MAILEKNRAVKIKMALTDCFGACSDQRMGASILE